MAIRNSHLCISQKIIFFRYVAFDFCSVAEMTIWIFFYIKLNNLPNDWIGHTFVFKDSIFIVIVYSIYY
jgi:hypothetical protein